VVSQQSRRARDRLTDARRGVSQIHVRHVVVDVALRHLLPRQHVDILADARDFHGQSRDEEGCQEGGVKHGDVET